MHVCISCMNNAKVQCQYNKFFSLPLCQDSNERNYTDDPNFKCSCLQCFWHILSHLESMPLAKNNTQCPCHVYLLIRGVPQPLSRQQMTQQCFQLLQWSDRWSDLYHWLYLHYSIIFLSGLWISDSYIHIRHKKLVACKSKALSTTFKFTSNPTDNSRGEFEFYSQIAL